MKKYKYWQLYMLFSGIYQTFLLVTAPIIAIILLNSEINIWIFEWIISIISTLLIVLLSTKRNNKNREKYMIITAFLLLLNLIIFVFNFNVFWYIFFSLIMLILQPLYRVSQHVFDLSLMDSIKIKSSDFYPAMLFRDITLTIWRLWVILLMSLLVISWIETEVILKIWLIWAGLASILTSISIWMYNKHIIKSELQ